jgi:hypothetical protein
MGTGCCARQLLVYGYGRAGNQEIIREDCVGGNVKRYAPTQDRPAELVTELWTVLSEQGTDQMMREVWTWRHVSRPRARSREQLMGTGAAQECYWPRRLFGKTLEVAWERAFIRTSHF